MSCPQIIAWYPRRDMMGDVNVDIMTKGLYPAQQEKSIKDRIQRSGILLKNEVCWKLSNSFLKQNQDINYHLKYNAVFSTNRVLVLQKSAINFSSLAVMNEITDHEHVYQLCPLHWSGEKNAELPHTWGWTMYLLPSMKESTKKRYSFLPGYL